MIVAKLYIRTCKDNIKDLKTQFAKSTVEQKNTSFK